MTRRLGAVVVLMIVSVLLAPAPTTAATRSGQPYCGITWGSLAKASASFSSGEITGVRTGRHSCYDRLVIDLNGSRSGYSVAYADQVLTEGQGVPISLRGGARLAITVLAPAYDDAGDATYLPAHPGEVRNVRGYQTFRQVAWGGTFEGYTTIGLGVRARLPFRVFTLEGPGSGSRLVIDVAHYWQAPGVAAPATSAAAPFCGITWGSLAKSSAAFTTGDIVDVRTGRHSCYDRLVIDLNGPRSGYAVAYVDQVRQDGSGLPIEVRGGARLEIFVRAPAHDEDYNPTYRPADPTELRDVGGYRTFRQVAWGGTYEGDTQFALGVRARLPFRVFTLEGPGSGSRLVIDVAHRW